MQRQSAQLRRLLREKVFLHMPSVYDPLGGRLVQSIGFEAAYIGGYVTGGSLAVTEPLLTMTEQVRLAGDIARSIGIPLVADAGAGFGEPLHTMRTVREFIRNDVAGIHLEDQLYPNPRTPDEAEQAPKACRLPLVYVQSRGNRDGRPIFSRQELQQMGYVACIDAQLMLCSALHYQKEVLGAVRETGQFDGMTQQEWVAARQEVEDLIDLTRFYEIEAQTVEARQPHDQPGL